MLLGHLNVIYNVNIKASNIHLRKYSGCDLDNFEKSYGKDGYWHTVTQ